MYFNYFNIDKDRAIEDILAKDYSSISSRTNTSSLYSNKSKRDTKKDNKSKEELNPISIDSTSSTSRSSIDSSSLNYSNNSKEETLTINIIESKRSSSSSSSSNTNTSNLEDLTKNNTTYNKGNLLNNRNLRTLEAVVISPSKANIIEDYIDNTNRPIVKNTSNIKPSIIEEEEYYNIDTILNSSPPNIIVEGSPSIQNYNNPLDNNTIIPSTNIEESYSLNTREPLDRDLERDINRFNIASSLAIPSSIAREGTSSNRSKRSYSNRASLSSSIKDNNSYFNNIEDSINIEEDIINIIENKRSNKGRPKKIKTRGRPRKG